MLDATKRAQLNRMFTIEPHPLLDAKVFATTFPRPLRDIVFDPMAWFTPDAAAPLQADDSVRAAVRDLLRHGGFKPTGRSKPASEYLIKAAANEKLSTINAAVDVCNVVSLHSGLPISVIDLDRAKSPLRIAIAPEDTSYVFNASGQTIKLDGLLCLFDNEGACANAVKDCQRTKTDDDSTRTLTIIWGTSELPGRAQAAMDWYVELLGSLDASFETWSETS